MISESKATIQPRTRYERLAPFQVLYPFLAIWHRPWFRFCQVYDETGPSNSHSRSPVLGRNECLVIRREPGATRGLPHVVVDAQFRLVPETNMAGMLADAKRAVAWFIANAKKYGVDPQRIVSAGFSAGGQLALLVAYTSRDRHQTPPELWGVDLTIHAAVSHAGCYDLQALYDHSRQWLPVYAKLAAQDEKVCAFVYRLSDVLCRVTGNAGKSEALARKFAHLAIAAYLPSVLGGTPDEVPEAYTHYSPISYAGPGAPPTFLVQGADDIAAPAEVAYELSATLHSCGVPVVNLVFPHAEHGFDLVLPRVSPVASAACQACRARKSRRTPKASSVMRMDS